MNAPLTPAETKRLEMLRAKLDVDLLRPKRDADLTLAERRELLGLARRAGVKDGPP